MYQLTVKKRFAAAHRLIGYHGQCAQLHGHTWQVEITVSGDRLDEKGMLLDFKELKNLVHQVIEDLDHRFLNDLSVFEHLNPTAENLARYIYDRLRPLLAPELKLSTVRVWESPDACACYAEDERS